MTQSREKSAVAPRPAVWMRRADKKRHIVATMEALTESGAGGMTALHIADRAGYRVSPQFRDLLWELVDEKAIFADSKQYNGGACDVRWLFYLPEVFRTKQAIKKMRDRDRRS
jgi:hypothetical protein